MKIRPFIDGTLLDLSIELTQEELQALNLGEQTAALPSASFVFTIDFHKLRPWFKQVLRSKSKRTVMEGGAIQLRTAGARPLRPTEFHDALLAHFRQDVPPLPPTVREPGKR